MGGAFVLQFLTTFFWMPESAFHRPNALNIDTGDRNIVVEKMDKAEIEHRESSGRNPENTVSTGSETKKSWKRELLPYDGYFDKASFWRTFLRPFVMLASPAVLWATLLFTTCISWLVLISLTLSQVFSAPPYSFSVSAVGASNLSSLVATLLATAIAGPLIDGLVTYMSKKNKGIFGKSLYFSTGVAYENAKLLSF